MNPTYLINRNNWNTNFSFNNHDNMSPAGYDDSFSTDLLDDTDLSEKIWAIADQFLKDELLKLKIKNLNQNNKAHIYFLINSENLDEKNGYELNAFGTNFIKNNH